MQNLREPSFEALIGTVCPHVDCSVVTAEAWCLGSGVCVCQQKVAMSSAECGAVFGVCTMLVRGVTSRVVL